jgi:hypothetical protein
MIWIALALLWLVVALPIAVGLGEFFAGPEIEP